MATYTQKLKLEKPTLDELYDITVFNSNADLIDQAFRELDTDTIVRLNANNDFTGKNKFDQSPTVPSPMNGDEAANKNYVDKEVSTLQSLAESTYVAIDGDQEIHDTKVFTKSPTVPTPTNEEDVTNKGYVDNLVETINTDIAGRDRQNVKLEGNQTVNGIKTFTSSPVVPEPLKDTEAANKHYVDTVNTTLKEELQPQIDELNRDAVLTHGNQRISDIKTFLNSPSVPSPTKDNDAANKLYVDGKVNQGINGFQNQIDDLLEKDSQNVKLTGAQTIKGTKTFSELPVSTATPVASNQLTTKEYVDNVASDTINQFTQDIADLKTADEQNVKLTGDQIINDSKSFTTPPTIPTPTDSLHATNKNYVDDLVEKTRSTLDTKLDEHITEFKSGDVEIGGLKTFTVSPKVPDPAEDDDVTDKKYVDDLVTNLDNDLQPQIDDLVEKDTHNVKLEGTQVINGTKTFNDLPQTSAVPTNDVHITNKKYVDDTVQSAKDDYDKKINAIRDNNQTFKGNDTFSGSVTFSKAVTAATAPTNNNHLTNKAYVDAQDASERAYVDEQIEITTSTLQQMITGLKSFVVQIVTDKAQMIDENIVYLLKSTLAQEDDIYDEYLVISGKPERIGSTKIDMSKVVYQDKDQSIDSIKTFTKSPTVPNPTTDTQAANKIYVDTQAASATTSAVNQAKSYTDSQVTSVTSAYKSYTDEAIETLTTDEITPIKTNITTLQNADKNNVKISGNQTIGGVKTFSALPQAATAPTSNNQLSNKKYVDDTVSAAQTTLQSSITTLTNADKQNVKLTGAQTVNGVKTFGEIPILPETDPESDNQAARKAYVDAQIKAVDVSSKAVMLTGDQSVAGVKTFTSLPKSSAVPSTGNDLVNKTYVDSVVEGDISDLDGKVVRLTGAQTISGVKTFEDAPTVPTPVKGTDAANKDYVDDSIAAVDVSKTAVMLTGAQTVKGVKTFSDLPVSNVVPIEDGQLANKKYVDDQLAIIDGRVTKLETADYLTPEKLDELHYIRAEKVSSYEEAAEKSKENPTVLYYWDDGSGGSTTQVNADWNATEGPAQILNKPELATVATSGKYEDLIGTPTIPTTSDCVKLTGNQTIAGTKTFSSLPVCSVTPTGNTHLANKKYVDDTISTATTSLQASIDTLTTADGKNVKTTGAQSVAGVKTFTSIPVLPSSDPTTDNQATRKVYVDAQIKANKVDTSGFVNTTTAQTVAGVKTFSAIPVLPASNPTTDNQAARKAYVDSKISGLATVASTGAYSDLTGTPTIPAVGTLTTTSTTTLSTATSESLSGTINLHKVAKTGTYSDLIGKPTIPAAPGNLITNATTAQTASEGEAMSGNITLHKVAKTGSYNDLLNRPTIPSTSDCVKTSGAQTIAGVKTFSSVPVCSTAPTSNNQLANKAYVDGKVGTVSANTPVKIVVSASKPAEESGVTILWVEGTP